MASSGAYLEGTFERVVIYTDKKLLAEDLFAGIDSSLFDPLEAAVVVEYQPKDKSVITLAIQMWPNMSASVFVDKAGVSRIIDKLKEIYEIMES